jgi:hypothetical protein
MENELAKQADSRIKLHFGYQLTQPGYTACSLSLIDM